MEIMEIVEIMEIMGIMGIMGTSPGNTVRLFIATMVAMN